MTPEQARVTLAELVMAWAEDIETGRPRYIGTLSRAQTGLKCGCSCASCGEAVMAVNAGRNPRDCKKRPHFRHKSGASRDNCDVLATRWAALHLLHEHGQLTLPKRVRTAQVTGLDGISTYRGAAEAPPQILRFAGPLMISNDRAYGLLTLDDGRQLKVILNGSIEVEDSGAYAAVVDIDMGRECVDLTREQLLDRVRLVDSFKCLRYAGDQELDEQARQQAQKLASSCLDAIPEGVDIPENLPSWVKRETVLHHYIKEILAEEKIIHVPVPRLDTTGCYDFDEGTVVELNNVRLEHRVGYQVPDVIADVVLDGQPGLFWIEVTVTNTISDERREKIQKHCIPALEIDLSLLWSEVFVNVEDIKKAVIDEIRVKKWIWHPAIATEIDMVLRKKQVLAEPIRVTADRYLTAALAVFDEHRRCDGADIIVSDTALAALSASIEEMAWRGYAMASNGRFVGYHGILSRVLSIKKDTGIGYRVNTGWEVVNACIQATSEVDVWEHAIYLVAIDAYKPKMNVRQQKSVSAWREKARQGYKNRDSYYKPDENILALLELLFPEIENKLRKLDERWNTNQLPRRKVKFQKNQASKLKLFDAAQGFEFDTPISLESQLCYRWRVKYNEGKFRGDKYRKIDWMKIYSDVWGCLNEGGDPYTLIPAWMDEYQLIDSNILVELVDEAKIR